MIGLIAPLSGGSAASGEAIQRGMLLALDEVNRAGGVLGRPLSLVVRDVQNGPPAGVAALRELVQQHAIVAVFGGIFSPVMLAQLDAIHELEIPLINPWGSLTAIARNGRTPNYAFRVAASDEQANEFLARYAVAVVGARRPGIIADTTAWGSANTTGLTESLTRLGTPLAGTERFAQGDTNMQRQLDRLRAAGVLTLQTFSFAGPLSSRGEAVARAYHARFGTRRVEEILAPVGVAHGYDGVHLLAQAIRQAGTTAGPRVRAALEHMPPFEGLVKRYALAFTPERHDPLLAEDYLMAVWQNGRLVPAPQPRLRQGT